MGRRRKPRTPEASASTNTPATPLGLPHGAVIRLPEVLALTRVSRSYIYAKISRGEFPRQIKLGKRASGWRAADVADGAGFEPTTRGL